MCDIPNDLPLTHEFLSHHINAQAPPSTEAFTKVSSHHQELIYTIEPRCSTRITTRSTAACHFTKLVHGVHHATPLSPNRTHHRLWYHLLLRINPWLPRIIGFMAQIPFTGYLESKIILCIWDLLYDENYIVFIFWVEDFFSFLERWGLVTKIPW